jgi:hypothetical protein
VTSSLKLVAELFPHLRERVACLHDQDVVFREMCEDYEACSLALSRTPVSDGLNQEYASLQLRLEYELLRYMSEESIRAGGRK